MQGSDRKPSRLRRPILLPLFSQLEVLNGKSRLTPLENRMCKVGPSEGIIWEILFDIGSFKGSLARRGPVPWCARTTNGPPHVPKWGSKTAS